MKTFTHEEIQAKANQIVERHIIQNCNEIVTHIMQKDDELDNWYHLMYRPLDDEDYKEAAHNEDYHELGDYDDWEDLCNYEGVEAEEYRREVLTYVQVSDWLLDRLEEQGESVEKDFYGLCVWGRTTFGQCPSIDGVMYRIAKSVLQDCYELEQKHLVRKAKA